MLKEVYLNTKRETTILLYILEGGGGSMGTGRPLWLVVLGPHHHWWVVLVPCHQLRVVLLGPRRFSWVEWLGAGHIVRGWWWCALIMNGGGGAPSLVFVQHGRHHCRGGLVVPRGRGW